MELFHYITVLCISEQEAQAFAGAGVKFKEVIRAISGESSVTFEVGEQDRRWNRIVTLLKSLEGNDRLSKENRVRDLSMTTATMEAALRSAGESIAAFNGGYSLNSDRHEFGDPPRIPQRVDDILGGEFAHDQCQVTFEGCLDGASIDPLHVLHGASAMNYFHDKFGVLHRLLCCLKVRFRLEAPLAARNG